MHSDGLIIDFKYDDKGEKIEEIINSKGVKEILTESDDGITISIEIYAGEKMVQKELKFSVSEMHKRINSKDEEDARKNLEQAAKGTLPEKIYYTIRYNINKIVESI